MRDSSNPSQEDRQPRLFPEQPSLEDLALQSLGNFGIPDVLYMTYDDYIALMMATHGYTRAEAETFVNTLEKV